jgi:phenylalanyl-tRNA synthetase alpha chain
MNTIELSYNEKKILILLSQIGRCNTEQIKNMCNFNEMVEVMSAISWLEAKGLVIVTEKRSKYYSLDTEGKKYAEIGLPERRALTLFIGTKVGLPVSLSHYLSETELDIAIGWLKQKGFIQISKNACGETMITPTPKGIEYFNKCTSDELVLLALKGDKELSEEVLNSEGLMMLTRRKNVLKCREIVHRNVAITEKGRFISRELTLEPEVSQLTPDLIKSGKWREVALRKYQVDMFAPEVWGGKPHPLTQLIEEIRDIYVSMGFTEVNYDFIVLNFWNMDVLFMPQDHPARDMQDIFFLDLSFEIPDKKLVSKIKDVHESGSDTGSIGWQRFWSEREAARVVLRSQTTADTIRYLYEHPEEEAKIFSIGRNFRRESIDYKHLPEFIQVDGIIVEKNANLGMLIGTLKEFCYRLGFEDIKIRPSYFPFTEPSLEVLAYFKGKLIELAGAGIFRPEVTIPLGVKYPVLAWAWGIDRLAMLKYDISDIRKLYLSDIEWLKSRRF